MSETIYKSCRFIEGGLSLSFDDIRACAVLHNGRGRPKLADIVEGADISIADLQRARHGIRMRNQEAGHPDCIGCPHLETRDWASFAGQLTWIGITNYVYCNVLCTYCWLNYTDYSPMKDTKNRKAQTYRVGPLIDQLLDQDLLAKDAIIDWGGGGEPTLNPDFDHAFARLQAHGTTQWLHTNAVRMPKIAKTLTFAPDTLRILCSLDCGTKAGYAKIKQFDRFDRVMENLRSYRAQGAVVVPKFIVVPDNATDREADGFVALAHALDVRTVIIDIDHRFPAPTSQILATLRRIKAGAKAKNIHCRFEAVGSNSAQASLVAELNS